MNWPRLRCWTKTALACSVLAGCAAYHAAPLNLQSPLINSLAGLNATQPDGATIALAPPLTIHQVAALALLNDPALVAARAQHGVGQGEVFNASLLPDPSITAGFDALISGPADVPAISGGLAEDLSALITYRVNLQAARAGLAQVDANILWQDWQVAGQAEALCITIAADQQTLASRQADNATLARINQVTQQQVAANNLTIAASSASMAALAVSSTALNMAIQTRDLDLDQLDALLGLRPGLAVPVAPPVVASLSPEATARAITTLARRRPDLIALRYGYAQADASLRAAILTQFLPISVGVNGGRDTTRVWSVGPQLTLNLPLFNRNRGGIARARATRAALAAQFSASLAAADSGAEALAARINVLHAASRMATVAAVNAASIAAQAQTAFADGALDALSAVNLQTAAGERQRESIALQAQLLTATLALNTMLGIGLPPLVEPMPETTP